MLHFIAWKIRSQTLVPPVLLWYLILQIIWWEGSRGASKQTCWDPRLGNLLSYIPIRCWFDEFRQQWRLQLRSYIKATWSISITDGMVVGLESCFCICIYFMFLAIYRGIWAFFFCYYWMCIYNSDSCLVFYSFGGLVMKSIS